MTANRDRAAVPCRVGAIHQHMIDGGLHPPYGKIGGITPVGANANVSKLPPELANHPDYEIIRELGQGGMGVVFLAHNRIMGRDEVLKVIGPDIIESPGVFDRFLREIRAVARLQHPNIVTAHSAFRCGESLVFAMEYVEGLDLARLVKAKGPVPVGHACYFVHQAALGLQHAHEAGMVHRDIKPGNLMLTHKRGKALIKVLDFGLAKAEREQKVLDRWSRPERTASQAIWRPDASGADAGYARLHCAGADRRLARAPTSGRTSTAWAARSITC